MSRWPLLLTAALLLIAGAARVVQADSLDTLAASLLAAGFITLGVWLRDYPTSDKKED